MSITISTTSSTSLDRHVSNFAECYDIGTVLVTICSVVHQYPLPPLSKSHPYIFEALVRYNMYTHRGTMLTRSDTTRLQGEHMQM